MRRSRACAVLVSIALLATVTMIQAPARATAAFVVLSRAVRPPGTPVQVTGGGFGPSETVRIALDDTVVGSGSTGPAGAFSATITVPASALPGAHSVRATGLASGRSARAMLLVRTDWAQFGFSPHRRAFNPFENVLDTSNVSGLEEAWSFPTGGIVQSSPVVASGRVYVGSFDNNLYALRASTGRLVFKAFAGLPGSPAVSRGVVYVGGIESGILYAFDAGGCGQATCSPLWTAPTGDEIFSSPAVADGVAFIGSDDNKLYAFDADGCGAATCPPLWTGATGGDVATPAVAGGVVYVGSEDRKLYAFDADGCGAPTCSPLWTGRATGAIIGAPTVVHRVYVASLQRAVHAFDPAGCGAPTCSPLWTTPGAFQHLAAGGGVVYSAMSNCCSIRAFTASSGRLLWEAENILPTSAPALANGVLYQTSIDGHLYAFDASGCGAAVCPPIASVVTGEAHSSPAVANGMVFVGSNDTKLHAFSLPA